jgi:choline-sulfatase
MDLPMAFDCDPGKQLKHPVIDAMRKFWNYNDYFDATLQIEGLRNYYGLCSFLDDNVAQVLSALDDSGQAGNTQIIYTSDHGDMIGNHGIWCKSFMYEDAVGIPMTLSGPGISPSTNDTPVSLIDLAATIECCAGGETTASEHAWQSRPLQQFADNAEPDRPILSEYHDGGSPCGFYMLRRGPWKYVYYSEGNPDLLFNMEEDPQELVNLVEDPGHSSTVSELRDQLNQILDPEEVNRQAFADQAKMIEKLGGKDVINAMQSFNHTPIDLA